MKPSETHEPIQPAEKEYTVAPTEPDSVIRSDPTIDRLLPRFVPRDAALEIPFEQKSSSALSSKLHLIQRAVS